jgi:hypothetical protein
MRGGGEPLPRRVGVLAGRREAVGRRQPRRGGALAVAAQLVHAREVALRVRGVAAERRDLAPGAQRVGQVARQLRRPRIALERGEPLLGILAVRPQVDRLLAGARGVAVRVRGAEVVDRLEQRRAAARLLAGGQPVGGQLDARTAAPFEPLRDAAV